MKNIYVYIFIIGVILFIAGLWLSQRVEGFQSTAGLLLAGIGTDGTVYVADSGLTNIPNWSNISGKMTQISGSMGQIVGVNSSQQIWYTKQASAGMASTWKQIPGTATQVAFDFPKLVAIMGSSVGYIADVNAANPAFTMKNGPVGFKWIDISLGGAYAVGTDNKIYTCADITASSWSWTDITTGIIVGKTFIQLSCDAGAVAVVTESNELYYARNGGAWFQLTGRAVRGVAVRGSMLYAVGTDNRIWYSPSQIPNASWSSLSGTIVFSYVDCILPINAQIISERTAGNASCEDPTYEVVGAQCMSPCPSGYTANGATCVQGSTPRETSDPTLPAEVTYNCPSGEIQLSGAVCGSTQDPTNFSNNPALLEVYSVNGQFTQLEAQAKCESYGSALASYQQVENAQTAGAGWCSWGWITDDSINTAQISFPVQTTDSCYSNAPGVKVRLQGGGSEKYGANCYGVKPPLTVAGGVRPFNSTKWNQVEQCDFGYRVVFNASCKSGCPTGSISDPTYCTYDAVPKTSKAKQNINFTCPDGFDDPNVASCSNFKYNDTTKLIQCDTPAPTCYEKCPPGYTRNGTTCTPNANSSTSPNIAARQTLPATFSPPCEPGYKIVGTACYKDCDTGLNDVGTKCQRPSIARTTSETTIVKPTTPLCAADEEIINKKCVKKCAQGKFSTDTSCSTTSVARTVVAAKFTSPCNSNEDLLNGMCVSRCGPGESRVGSTCVPGKQRVDSPFCRSSNYGNYKRWLCDSQSDLNKLLKDPSSTTTYVNDNDQVCITSSPTTMMYYCQTVAETNSGGEVLDDIQNVAGTTCSNLLKNYMDLSGSIVSLTLIQSGMNDGSISLVAAKDKLTAVYNNLQCNTTTSDLCTSIQTSVGKIGGNVTTINSTNSAISGPITQAVQARQDLLASIQKFQCSP
jgi:hypothetical protein